MTLEDFEAQLHCDDCHLGQLGDLDRAVFIEKYRVPRDYDFVARQVIKEWGDLQLRMKTMLPAALRGILIAKHPFPNCHANVMAWLPGEKGLLLDGATGGGKTRSLVALIEKLETSQRYGAGISYHSAPVMGDKISALAFDSPHEMDRFLQGLEGAPILAIDDLGAQRATERVAASLHRIIDSRYARGLPILVSTNCTPDQLQKRLLDEHGRTIRRLKEMTEKIPFSATRKHSTPTQ